ncbi:hypothetical protein ABIA33_000239 [Streptacidiphilus sp. MAP12-16]
MVLNAEIVRFSKMSRSTLSGSSSTAPPEGSNIGVEQDHPHWSTELSGPVIVGHVDSWKLPPGKAAFYALGAAQKGDEVDVARADGTVVVFVHYAGHRRN